MDVLRDLYFSTAAKFSKDVALIEKCWFEIERAYSEDHRHYHNFGHLAAMWETLQTVKDEIVDNPLVVFSLFYHDVVYKTLPGGSNEESSSRIAARHLGTLQVGHLFIEDIQTLILATRRHLPMPYNDMNLFLDADLSILGASPEEYEQYRRAIRREYSLIPDIIYVPGRRKVLKHFLKMNPIFKTPPYRTRYEAQAKLNLTNELKSL